MTTQTLPAPEPDDSEQWDGTDIEPVFTIRYSEEQDPSKVLTLSDEYIRSYQEGDRYS